MNDLVDRRARIAPLVAGIEPKLEPLIYLILSQNRNVVMDLDIIPAQTFDDEGCRAEWSRDRIEFQEAREMNSVG